MRTFVLSSQDLTDVTIVSNGPVLGLIRWLQGQNLLANPLRCIPCNQAMDLNERNDDHMGGFLLSVYDKSFYLQGWRARLQVYTGKGLRDKKTQERRNLISQQVLPPYPSRSTSPLTCFTQAKLPLS